VVPPTDGKWVLTVADGLQVLVGALCGLLPMQCVHQVFEDIREPRNPTERLFLLGRVSDLLLDIIVSGKPVLRLDAFDAILAAWPSTRRHIAPLFVLRGALERRHDATAESDLAGQIRSLLEHRYADRLRARDIAGKLGISESKASRCFHTIYGSTIHQFLLSVRVKHGLRLVRQGDKIEAAAMAVGFRSKKDFYRAVQKLVGCTPGQFRRKGDNDA
jgi:AraC-like DNA-binding protein